MGNEGTCRKGEEDGRHPGTELGEQTLMTATQRHPHCIHGAGGAREVLMTPQQWSEERGVTRDREAGEWKPREFGGLSPFTELVHRGPGWFWSSSRALHHHTAPPPGSAVDPAGEGEDGRREQWMLAVLGGRALGWLVRPLSG